VTMTGATGTDTRADVLAVECAQLVKRFGDVTAVDGLDLRVRPGECFGLLGPNGAGKTTTVEILQGIVAPDSGSVRVLGLDWADDRDTLRSRLGSQLQETRFPDKLRVSEVLALFRSFYPGGLTVAEAMEAVRIEEKARAYVKTLSGGQHQRLAIACALIGDPDLLFLDEPTTGLDPQARHQLWDVILTLRGRGKTILLTTHYMEEAERLCDRVGVMDRGRMIALGTPAELVASLGAEHVVEFAVSEGARVERSVLVDLPGVRAVLFDAGRVRLTVGRAHETIPDLMETLRTREIELTELATHHATLEDVFLSLTGRHLRDD
jgi:ABC-2 type transport system ATP-binding protein